MSKKLRELCNGKVYTAIQHMIDGLKKADTREDFKISMHVFGVFGPDTKSNQDMCFGCAATCAAQSVTGIDIEDERIQSVYGRAEALNMSTRDLEEFENAIDNLRRGYVRAICEYFYGDGCILPDIFSNDLHLRSLRTDNWKEFIGLYQILADELRKIDY